MKFFAVFTIVASFLQSTHISDAPPAPTCRDLQADICQDSFFRVVYPTLDLISPDQLAAEYKSNKKVFDTYHAMDCSARERLQDNSDNLLTYHPKESGPSLDELQWRCTINSKKK